MAKQLLFADAARRKIMEGVDILAHAVWDNAWTHRTQRDSEQVFRWSARHQGRRDRFQGDRAERPVREHGCQARQRGGIQDVRRRRRRHDDRDDPGPRDLSRRTQEHHCRANPTAVRRGIEKAVEAAVTELTTKLSRPVSKKEEIAQVGSISANNDPTIGNMLADAVESVGRDGVITVEEGKTATTALEFVEGMQFDKGYLSPYFVTSPTTMEVIFEDRADLAAREEDQQSPRDDPAPGEGRPVRSSAVDYRRGG